MNTKNMNNKALPYNSNELLENVIFKYAIHNDQKQILTKEMQNQHEENRFPHYSTSNTLILTVFITFPAYCLSPLI